METKFKKESKFVRFKKKIPPLVYLFLSFFLLILAGTCLFLIPGATKEGQSISFIDALFVATSAVCVTGLSPIVVHDTFSIFGNIVLGLLIQLGGLGLVTVFSFFVLAISGKLSYSKKFLIKESLSQDNFKHLGRLLKFIIVFTLSTEACGAFACFWAFWPEYDVATAIGYSVFHAVSSFNNAGFDIIGPTSLISYNDDILLNLVTCLLIIIGGIGFLVIQDIIYARKWKNFSLQTKVVLVTNTFILVSSFFIIKGIEWDQITWLEAFFYSVNLRTCGFSTFDPSKLHNSTLFLSTALMLFGASPLSTGGGIKTTTVFVIIKSIESFARGKKTLIAKREISQSTKYKAFLLAIFASFIINVTALAITLFEGDKFTFMEVLYESTSAFGTVGLSMGITSALGVGSKVMLSFLMFFGRLGPVSIINLWNPHLNRVVKDEINYLPTHFMIG